jgi:hypothetical protein
MDKELQKNQKGFSPSKNLKSFPARKYNSLAQLEKVQQPLPIGGNTTASPN